MKQAAQVWRRRRKQENKGWCEGLRLTSALHNAQCTLHTAPCGVCIVQQCTVNLCTTVQCEIHSCNALLPPAPMEEQLLAQLLILPNHPHPFPPEHPQQHQHHCHQVGHGQGGNPKLCNASSGCKMTEGRKSLVDCNCLITAIVKSCPRTASSLF